MDSVFGLIIVCITICSLYEGRNKTRIKIAQVQADQAKKNAEVGGRDLVALRDELTALREQIRDLRDTTTQYDLSFDTALQRMERRVAQIEQQQQPTQQHAGL